MPVFHCRTYGCKTNQYESAAWQEALIRHGWTATDQPGDADVFLFNTCAVTARAASDVARDLRRLRRNHPSAKIVLSGCAVDLDEPWTQDPTLLLRLANRDKHTLLERLETWFPARAAPSPDGVAPQPDGDSRFAFALSRFAGHTRAFLKIQDGCDNYCAYCAVPRARGRPASRPPDEIAAEARRLVAGGHVEIALTGINIGAYDAGAGRDLAWLLRRLASDVPELPRLRLGSVEPPTVTDALIGAMAECPAVCPHIHLPLQSGDDGILNAMNRRYGVAAFLDAVRRLNRALPRPAITTDVIVGFPGEDEAAFERTRSLCADTGFSRLHVFPYSPRPGTVAARHSPPAPAIVAERRQRLSLLGKQLAETFATRFIGESVEILTETLENGVAGGYTRHYIPVRLLPAPSSGTSSPPCRPGACLSVLAVAVDGDGLIAHAGNHYNFKRFPKAR